MDKVIKSFSLMENLKILFTRRSTLIDKNLEFLNGVRVITLCFIILGNTYFYILKGPL